MQETVNNNSCLKNNSFNNKSLTDCFTLWFHHSFAQDLDVKWNWRKVYGFFVFFNKVEGLQTDFERIVALLVNVWRLSHKPMFIFIPT